MTNSLSQNSIKTFPIKINFDWLENRSEATKIENISRKVILIKGNGVILDRRLFFETTYNKLKLRNEIRSYFRNIVRTKIIFKSDIFILTDIWSTGPYHFYVDMLSKIVELKEQSEGKLKRFNFLIFDDKFTKKVIIPLLKDFDLESVKIIKLVRNQQYVFIGNNYFVTKPHGIGTNNPTVIPKVYDLIHSNLVKYKKTHDDTLYKGIYYYRTGPFRKIINDQELIRKLRNMGFYCTNFEELSYIEAFQIMQQTTLFVGIHGGGLTNMLFLPKNSKVIEIKNDNPNPNSHCYWHLARSLKFEYVMLVADTIGETRIVEGKGCDLKVNWTDLEILIQNYL